MSTKPNIPVKTSGDTLSATELNTIVDFFSSKPDTDELIEGPQGEPGIQGEPGEQGIPGDDGEPGPSAYDVAVSNGFVGTESEWLDSLVPVRYMDGDIFDGDGETPETKTTIKDGSIQEAKLSEGVQTKLNAAGPGDVTLTGEQTLTNKTLTSPKITSGDGIYSHDGRKMVGFSRENESSETYIDLQARFATVDPIIRPMGTGANLGINFVPKGGGAVKINGKVTPQSTTVFNVKTDVSWRYSQNNAVGNGSTNDQNALQYGMYASNDEKQIIYLPAGNFLVNSTIQLPYNSIEIRGSGIGKTTITIGASFSGTGPLFNIAGKSDFTISDLTITGNSKRIDAAIQLGSYVAADTQARRINIERVRFYNLWTTDAILFGGTSASPDTHTLGDVSINRCYFENIYEPAVPIAYLDETSRCNAINLNQTTNKVVITGNFIKNVSGDGIYAYGQTQTTYNPDYGDWLIHGNHIEMCFMGIEINGQYLPKGISIDNNIIKYSTRDAGYLISIDSYQASITNNRLYGVDRSLIEITSIGGVVENNRGWIVAHSATSGGVAGSSMPHDRSCAIEAYGFANLIQGNNFILDRTGAGTYTPTEFNGIKIVYQTTDPGEQPLSWGGIEDMSGYWDIKGNVIHGFTHRAIEATNDKIAKVNIQGNTFLSRNCLENAIGIYGYEWIVKGNIIDLKGSLNPPTGKGAIGVFFTQSDNTESIVQDNTIINDNWKIVDADKFVAFKNELVNTSTNLAYELYPAPPMTSTQRTALTGVEGMAVYQTDGTTGVYIYQSGSWAAQ